MDKTVGARACWRRNLLSASFVAALLMLACDRSPKPGLRSERVYQLRTEVSARTEFKDVRFGVVGEIAAGSTRAIVGWPAFRGTEVIDDDVVALVFRRLADRWQFAGQRKLSRSGGREALELAVGAKDFKVLRDCGIARRDLVVHLTSSTKKFRDARAASDTAAAIRAYEQLAWAFAWDHVAYSDMLPEMLIKGVDVRWHCSADSCKPKSDRRYSIEVQFAIEACGDGVVLGAMTKRQRSL